MGTHVFAWSVGPVIIECTLGDITAQEGFDAVVNAANAELRPGGGVAGAIHRVAGPRLEDETRLLAPIEPGQAVVTAAYGLPNRFVIHCLGPVYGRDEPAERLLHSCYLRALREAEEHGLDSIAFPAISTGAFGYPMEEAAHVALDTVKVLAQALESLRRVRFVLHDAEALEVHLRAAESLLERPPDGTVDQDTEVRNREIQES
ncbi:MAG TPA: macro domain-containing protein [Longimicrobiales bacterium]|nr:macro domain-containing protein [Longimicrobiales bacterium]